MKKCSHIVIGWNLALTKGSGWYRKRSLAVSTDWGGGGGVGEERVVKKVV